MGAFAGTIAPGESRLPTAPAPTEPAYFAVAAPVFPRSDRYTYVATIGQGGMGVIFRALDRVLGHEVALKVLRARDHDAIGRLKTEFRTRVDLHHPHLLQLLDLVITADEAFFTMELVDAVDFLDWVWHDGERGAPRRLATALAGVASALEALHAAGWVHFDVKPANILVDRGGRALLADFGLSTAIRTRAGAPARDVEGAGTPDYMAPERYRGGIVTPASDLYSVGAVILEALTGSPHGGSPHGAAPHAGHGRDRGDAARDEPLLDLARRLMADEPAARPDAHGAAAELATIAAAQPSAPAATNASAASPHAPAAAPGASPRASAAAPHASPHAVPTRRSSAARRSSPSSPPASRRSTRRRS